MSEAVSDATGNPDCEASLACKEPLAGSYFVSTYPPFSTWNSEEIANVYARLSSPSASAAPLGIYVHIPFCAERCRYCYYLSYANRPPAQIDAYLAAVLREAAIYRDRAALADRSPTFVYFGGGTPSLLNAEQIARFLHSLQTVFPWEHVREATFECAPQTVTEDRMTALREAGITRLSLGVQQLDDTILKANGRIHLVADVERAYPMIRRAGFGVVNIDLMLGMIGETDASFFASLDRVIDMQPESVTLYQLEIPLNTPLYHDLTRGTLAEPPPSWTIKHKRLELAFERLERAGYCVRSAYAAVRDPQRHRFIYQDAQYHEADLLGLGAASFSYLSGVHSQNQASLRSYLSDVDAHHLPLGRAHALSAEERLTRAFVLQFKLGRVRSEYFRVHYDVDIAQHFREPLSKMARAGWMTLDQDGVRVTRAGLVRIDRLLPEFYLTQHRDVRYS